MRHVLKEKEDGPLTEMVIVNTFTKLIFSDDGYTTRELSIVEALQATHANVAHDSRKEMGEYLRDLGVREMIQLVSGLQQYLSDCACPPLSGRGKPTSAATTGSPSNSRGSP